MANGYLDRLIEERRDLYGKMNKLNEFLHGDIVKTLDIIDISLLEIQYSCMEGYLKVMTARIERGE